MKPTGSMFRPQVEATTLDAAWKAIGARRIRARRMRNVWITSPVVVVVIALFVIVLRHRGLSLAPPTPAPIALVGGGQLPSGWVVAEPQEIRLDDGSRLELSANTRLRTGKNDLASRVELALDRGAVTFDIKPGGPRAWVIDAGNGTFVRVLGTRFSVTRDIARVVVSVERGKVRVESPGLGTRDLSAGEHVEIREQNTAPEARDSAPVPPLSLHVDDLPTAPAPSATTVTMERATKDRMAEADAARAAGKPRDAVAILSNVVAEGDPRAALAAFTIGKIHAEELSDPAGAAIWFERAISLGLPRGLDEDALVRAVESHGSAGHVEEAARAAARYETRFPEGRHLARVQRWTKE